MRLMGRRLYTPDQNQCTNTEAGFYYGGSDGLMGSHVAFWLINQALRYLHRKHPIIQLIHQYRHIDTLIIDTSCLSMLPYTKYSGNTLVARRTEQGAASVSCRRTCRDCASCRASPLLTRWQHTPA